LTCGGAVSAALTTQITSIFGPEHSAQGSPSKWDFWGGPLQAALLRFRDFASLPFDYVPQVRRLVVDDSVFGPVTFVAVLLSGDVVEIAACSTDPDHWHLIEDDPDD
jgi:hypothetical protein